MGNRLLTSCGISSSSVRAIDENQLLMDEHEKKSLERKETVMARIYQLLIVIGTIAAMILLIGCGQPATTGTTGLFTAATTTPSLRAPNIPKRTPPNAPTGTARPGPETFPAAPRTDRSN